MNYIAEINGFERWLETHPLPTLAQLLWYKLLYWSSRSGWPEWTQVDNRRLMVSLQIAREASLTESRERLVNAGLIEYQKGKKGSPGRYRMISIYATECAYNLKVQSEGKENPTEYPTEYPTEKPTVYPTEYTYNLKALINNKQKQKQKQNNPPLSPLQLFEDFWAAYPKEEPSAKHDTETAYVRAVAEGGGEADLLSAVRNYAEACRILKTEPEYIKMPDNFLKDRTFLRYLPGEYRKPTAPKKSAAADRYNAGIMSRDVDFDTLERELLGKDR